jgi:hypothetical protein
VCRLFCWLQLFRAEGITGLYKGNGANVARVLPVHGLKFGMNDFFKRVVAPGQSNPGTSQLLQAGVLAGLTQQCTTLPLEVVRTRMTVGATLQPPMVYKGILNCLGTIVRTEGVRGLYVSCDNTEHYETTRGIFGWFYVYSWCVCVYVTGTRGLRRPSSAVCRLWRCK